MIIILSQVCECDCKSAECCKDNNCDCCSESCCCD